MNCKFLGRREAAKLKMVSFAFFAASREIREVLKLSSSRFCLTRRREGAKLKMVSFAFFAASREIREVLNLFCSCTRCDILSQTGLPVN